MVRQSAKRTRIPIVLSIDQIAALLRVLKESTRTMVFLAVFTGLRVCELPGLKWKDIDFQEMEIHVIRSIVMHRWVTAKRRHLGTLFHSIFDWRTYCRPGGCRVHAPSIKTGCSPAHTVEANCRTGKVRPVQG